MKNLIGLAVVVYVTSCSTAEKSDQPLDIKMSPVVTDEKASPDGAKSQDGGITFNQPVAATPESVLEWSKFFQPPPSKAARRAIEKRLATWKDTEKVPGLLERARLEVAVGRHEAAEITLRQALRLDQTSLEALLEIASLCVVQRRTREAFELFADLRKQLALAEKPPISLVYRYRYMLAVAYLQRGDRAQAHEVLSDLIGLDKTFAPAYAALASSYLAMEKYSLADFIAKRALDRAKEHESIYNILGVVSEARGEQTGALEYYNKAIKMSPTFAPAYVNRGNFHLKQLDMKLAEADLQQALQHDPRDVEALVSMAVVQRRTKKAEGAKDSLNKALAIAPDNAFARFNLAVLLADELKQPHEALRLFREVIASNPQSQQLRDMAAVYVKDINSEIDRL